MQANATVGIGHNRGPALDPAMPPPSWLMGRRARLARRGRSVATSGRARADEWVLRFERETPPFIEPLMGWTAGDDPLAQVELTFETRAAALAYAERQGLEVEVQDRSSPVPLQDARTSAMAALDELGGTVIWLDAFRSAYGRCELSALPDLERALVNPASVFRRPEEVLRHPRLSLDCKREILWRWAWDEHLKEIAAEEGMASGEPSCLDEVKAALLELGQRWTPGPAAPAALVVAYRHDPALTALAA